MCSTGLPRNILTPAATRRSGRSALVAATRAWDEEGRDSEGYWHESDVRASYLFRPDDAGQYTLSIVMDEATVPTVDVEVTVKSGVWLGHYFVIMAALCAAFCLLFWMLGSGRKIDLSGL